MIGWMLDKYRIVEIDREVRRLERRIAKYNANFWTSIAISNEHRDAGNEEKKVQYRDYAVTYIKIHFGLKRKKDALMQIRASISEYIKEEIP